MLFTGYPRVCLDNQAGVDNAWEQEKPEARKMLENVAESHASDARFVRWRFDFKLLVYHLQNFWRNYCAQFLSLC